MEPRRTFLKNILLAGGGSMLLPWKTLANTLLSPYEVQQELALRTTRWNYPSILYLINWGVYEQANMESYINYTVNKEFNAIRINLHWNNIYPNQAAINNGGNWSNMDHFVNYATAAGLKLIITIRIRHDTSANPFFDNSDKIKDVNGNLDTNWENASAMSLASPKIGKGIFFIQQVAERYKNFQNQGKILFISPLITREAELFYGHNVWEDYNLYFLTEFRNWLSNKYGTSISSLNSAWASSYADFNSVMPNLILGTTAFQDWIVFRDSKGKQFIDSVATSLNAITGLTLPYRIVLDYGNLGDTGALRRGSIGFGYHASNPNVWGIKQNDAHDYNQDYTGSLLGSTAALLGKTGFNEYFYDADATKYPTGNIVTDSVHEITGHYKQGMNGVSYVIPNNNADINQIITALKNNGVWNAPVAQREINNSCTKRIKYSELLAADPSQYKNILFDNLVSNNPNNQVDIIIDRDVITASLPIILPINYLASNCSFVVDDIEIINNQSQIIINPSIATATTFTVTIKKSSDNSIVHSVNNYATGASIALPIGLQGDEYGITFVDNAAACSVTKTIFIPQIIFHQHVPDYTQPFDQFFIPKITFNLSTNGKYKLEDIATEKASHSGIPFQRFYLIDGVGTDFDNHKLFRPILNGNKEYQLGFYYIPPSITNNVDDWRMIWDTNSPAYGQGFVFQKQFFIKSSNNLPNL